MKKQLLTIASVFAMSYAAQAQEFFNQTFENTTIGPVTTAAGLNGSLEGQGGIFTYQSQGTDANITQIVQNNLRGKVLQIKGTGAFSPIIAFRGFEQEWESRTAGNDIIHFENWFYTGAVGNGFENFEIWDEDGLSIGGLQYDNTSGRLIGLGLGTNSTTGAISTIGLNLLPGSTTSIMLPFNTWVKIGYAYNVSTGVNHYYVDQANLTYTFAAGANRIPLDLNLSIYANTGAATTNVVTNLVDNINIRAISEFQTLSTETVEVSKLNVTELSIYPNPAGDVLNLSILNANMNAAAIVDINGRTVKNVNLGGVQNTTINTSDLASGVYMLNVTTETGTMTKKFIKK